MRWDRCPLTARRIVPRRVPGCSCLFCTTPGGVEAILRSVQNEAMAMDAERRLEGRPDLSTMLRDIADDLVKLKGGF